MATTQATFQIKNISGRTLSLALGRSWMSGQSGILNNGTATVPYTNEAFQAALLQVQQGRIEILRGPADSSFLSSVGNPGYIPITFLNADHLDDGDKITFGAGTDKAVTFEFDTNAAVAAGNVLVDLTSLTTATTQAGAFIAAVNANAILKAQDIRARVAPVPQGSSNVLVLVTFPSTIVPTSYITTTASGAELTIGAAVLAVDPTPQRTSAARVTAAGVTLTITTGLTVINAIVGLVVRTSSEVVKLFDGTINIAGGMLFLSGGTSGILASGDTVDYMVVGK